MTDDERKELLAQAIWMGQHGTLTIDARWTQYAADNPTVADALRKEAASMIAAAKNISGHHSLGWLMNG